MSQYWLEKAASQHHISALDTLADCYKERNEMEKTFELFTKSSSLGSSYAKYELSLMYRDGLFVVQDLTKSLRLLVSSANQNNLLALSDMGIKYMRGEDNLQKDLYKAYSFFLKSSELAQSQFQIGLMYVTGNEILSQNISLAIEWLERASIVEEEAAQLLESIRQNTEF